MIDDFIGRPVSFIASKTGQDAFWSGTLIVNWQVKPFIMDLYATATVFVNRNGYGFMHDVVV